MISNRVYILDTTLRDGIKSLEASLSLDDKVRIAQQLAELQVDVIEAGFAAAGEGDFNTIKKISEKIENTILCSLSRVNQTDIELTAKALEKAKKSRIHLYASSSNVKKNELLNKISAGIRIAKNYFSEIQFSPHNATRISESVLLEMVQVAVDEGVKIINISDTLGYVMPEQFAQLIEKVKKLKKDLLVGVHCHNDLGLAVANSLAAIKAGARQVECTINGIGERAGNAALEEIVMTHVIHKSYFKTYLEIKMELLKPSCDLVSDLAGVPIPTNKPIVGKNALNYDADIFRNGFAKDERYEIINAKDIGLST